MFLWSKRGIVTYIARMPRALYPTSILDTCRVSVKEKIIASFSCACRVFQTQWLHFLSSRTCKHACRLFRRGPKGTVQAMQIVNLGLCTLLTWTDLPRKLSMTFSVFCLHTQTIATNTYCTFTSKIFIFEDNLIIILILIIYPKRKT